MNPPKMPIHIGDYQRDTGHLRAVEHGAYLLLMFHYWSTGGLPDNDDHLAAIARLSRGEWNKHKSTLQTFFKDGWKHGRIDYDLEKARNISDAAREAGKASGRSRSVKPSLNDRSSSVEPTLEPSNHSNHSKKKEPRAVALDDDWPADHGDQFWQAYPRKTEKLAAMKKLATLRKSGIVTFADLIAGAKRYAAATSNTEPKYVKQPTTWLNAGCWADEIQTGGGNGNGNLNPQRRSASADFFAGMRSLAADIVGDDQPSGPAEPEVPLGRFNIDG